MFELSGVNYEAVLEQGDSILVYRDYTVCTSGEQVTVNNSSALRNSNISVSVGTKLHENCRKEFTRKTSIDAYRKHLNIEKTNNIRVINEKVKDFLLLLPQNELIVYFAIHLSILYPLHQMEFKLRLLSFRKQLKKSVKREKMSGDT